MIFTRPNDHFFISKIFQIKIYSWELFCFNIAGIIESESFYVGFCDSSDIKTKESCRNVYFNLKNLGNKRNNDIFNDMRQDTCCYDAIIEFYVNYEI